MLKRDRVRQTSAVASRGRLKTGVRERHVHVHVLGRVVPLRTSSIGTTSSSTTASTCRAYLRCSITGTFMWCAPRSAMAV